MEKKISRQILCGILALFLMISFLALSTTKVFAAGLPSGATTPYVTGDFSTGAKTWTPAQAGDEMTLNGAVYEKTYSLAGNADGSAKKYQFSITFDNQGNSG